jgi:hypothetical protein
MRRVDYSPDPSARAESWRPGPAANMGNVLPRTSRRTETGTLTHLEVEPHDRALCAFPYHVFTTTLAFRANVSRTKPAVADANPAAATPSAAHAELVQEASSPARTHWDGGGANVGSPPAPRQLAAAPILLP